METLTGELINFGVLGIFAALIMAASVWLFRQLGPRLVALLDAQVALTNSLQTSLLGTTGALTKIDKSLRDLADKMQERADEDIAWKQHMAAQMNHLEQSFALLAAARSGETSQCGSEDCPAMRIIQRPHAAQPRKDDDT